MSDKYEPFQNYTKESGNLSIEFKDYDSELTELYNLFEKIHNKFNYFIRMILNECDTFDEIIPKAEDYIESSFQKRRDKLESDEKEGIKLKGLNTYKKLNRDNQEIYENRKESLEYFQDNRELFRLVMKYLSIIDDKNNVCKVEGDPMFIIRSMHLHNLIEVMKSGKDVKFLFEYINKMNVYQIIYDSELIKKRIYERDITIFNTDLENIIIKNIDEFYKNDSLDIIGIYIAPGNKIIFPNYLLENLSTKNIGLIYIQDSTIHGGYSPFWLSDDYDSLLKSLNEKINKKIEIKIIQYTISNMDSFIEKLDNLINKKTSFYLGFTQCGKMVNNSYNLNFKNSNIVLTGCDGYKLPTMEEFYKFPENKLYNDLNYKTPDTEIIKKFLEEDVIIGGYYKKYLKYKRKYLKLKSNNNLQ